MAFLNSIGGAGMGFNPLQPQGQGYSPAFSGGEGGFGGLGGLNVQGMGATPFQMGGLPDAGLTQGQQFQPQFQGVTGLDVMPTGQERPDLMTEAQKPTDIAPWLAAGGGILSGIGGMISGLDRQPTYAPMRDIGTSAMFRQMPGF